MTNADPGLTSCPFFCTEQMPGPFGSGRVSSRWSVSERCVAIRQLCSETGRPYEYRVRSTYGLWEYPSCFSKCNPLSEKRPAASYTSRFPSLMEADQKHPAKLPVPRGYRTSARMPMSRIWCKGESRTQGLYPYRSSVYRLSIFFTPSGRASGSEEKTSGSQFLCLTRYPHQSRRHGRHLHRTSPNTRCADLTSDPHTPSLPVYTFDYQLAIVCSLLSSGSFSPRAGLPPE
ncbi:uncharacterized protein CCOS01_15208 [Colletotrichum costaricense]|uniref:Uncharacterized protein n=1 Tax=Colletotrichum costaricense TaxID=1209916 RepID=A0AAI9YI57_9PEZI|nr:uncharacterized protein CCOS01_15208 [Colletotrichum costaricense]KAK1510377.1 hypothetical protein CCOS01_15208 [Colletotrichum costaricense]